MVKIKVFRVDQDRDECLRYVEGHKKVLESYGVTKVTSSDLSWMEEPFTYITLVKSTDTGQVLGGGRLQIAGGKFPLPIETAIDQMDPRIFELVKEKARRGAAEYCGLWNSKKIAGFGIGSAVLMRVGTAILEDLKINTLFTFCSPATVRRVKALGLSTIEDIGNNGTFYYPKEDLLATALMLEDPLVLKNATPFEREKVFELRKCHHQKLMQRGPKGSIEVELNLEIKKEIALDQSIFKYLSA